jgi:hypothetical protein
LSVIFPPCISTATTYFFYSSLLIILGIRITAPGLQNFANDPLRGLSKYQMTKFKGDEKEYGFWKFLVLEYYVWKLNKAVLN